MCNVMPQVKERRELQPAGTIDVSEMRTALLDFLEDDKAELFLSDTPSKVFRKDEVKSFLKLDEVSSISFIPELHDCDDYARKLFGRGVPLVWTNLHAMNWIITPDGELWFIEPQTDKLSLKLENWQGWDVRFFLSV